MVLDSISEPKDLKKLQIKELNVLAEEIRKYLIQKISKTGGHLASNLGVVELTIALHTVFDAPIDKIIFDVSHQTYVHKILTNRKQAFTEQEHYDEVSGYSNPEESEYDIFKIGHTSSSVSLACGIAKARDLKHQSYNVIAVIGDASLDGGESFEALNFAKELDSNLIVIVNDNDMSIPENHGALNKHLNYLKDEGGITMDNYFRSLGFEYRLVKDGHNIEELMKTFRSVKGSNHPVVIHCCTKKGKGYSYAEENSEKWHWSRAFDIETGVMSGGVPTENYGSLVAEHLLTRMKNDLDLVVVAASTPLCIGFNSENRKKAGSQYIDVGIAEQHAISMIAGIAKAGGKPVFGTNSTFYQRAYDQIEQEMCLSKCPATMIVTHASVWGHTNDTHVGLYDIALFSHIPNLVYLAPTSWEEYSSMLDWSIDQNDYPVAIRVPWTKVCHSDRTVQYSYDRTAYEVVSKGNQVAILALGSFFEIGKEIVRTLEATTGTKATLINPRFITGLDIDTLEYIKKDHELIVTLEDGIIYGGFGSKIAQYFSMSPINVMVKGFSTEIPTQYKPATLMKENRLTVEQVVEDIIDALK